MNVGRKLMLIVFTSVTLVTVPASFAIYHYAKNKLLAGEAADLVKETNDIAVAASQNIERNELSVKALANAIK
jgi:hypothetical protein